jgi:hypothetical protein
MDGFHLEARQWADEQCGAADLGDRRRTKRLVHLAAQIAAHPSGSLPQQTETWADLKAAYRLFDADAVTFAAVAAPHWARARQCPPGRYLVLSDTTEVDVGVKRQIPALGPTGNGWGYGFLLHSALVLAADTDEIRGLAAQALAYRRPAPKGESTTQRLKRSRESEVWGAVIDQVGAPPAGVEWVHVADRGADNFEVYCHAQDCQTQWVVRVAQLGRKVLTPAGTEVALRAYLAGLPPAGSTTLELRARPQQPARTAALAVAFGAVAVLPPKQRSPYLRQRGAAPIPMTVVQVTEVGTPRGARPLVWVLYTSRPVRSLAEALQVVEDYGRRWWLEEWHKALKTGCRVADHQLQTKERLEPLVGLLSVEAVRLLQLKSVARADPQRPVEAVAPLRYVQVLRRVRRGRPVAAWTAGVFWRELAKLGGFLGRTGDGDPGWMTLWRGWEKLALLVRGAELAHLPAP